VTIIEAVLKAAAGDASWRSAPLWPGLDPVRKSTMRVRRTGRWVAVMDYFPFVERVRLTLALADDRWWKEVSDMPRFDGTGPKGGGPLTGRGEGYCVLELPEHGRPVQGYAGLEGAPVRLEAPAARWPPTPLWRGPAFGRGRGRASRRDLGRGPGRRHGWW